MTHISPKVGGCDIGLLVHDYALGMNGIVVSGAWTEKNDPVHTSGNGEFQNLKDLDWEWLVLYDDGELQGADTNDLQVINESH